MSIHFVEAIHWMARASAYRCELPDDFGKWNSVFKRQARWEENGIWANKYR